MVADVDACLRTVFCKSLKLKSSLIKSYIILPYCWSTRVESLDSSFWKAELSAFLFVVWYGLLVTGYGVSFFKRAFSSTLVLQQAHLFLAHNLKLLYYLSKYHLGSCANNNNNNNTIYPSTITCEKVNDRLSGNRFRLSRRCNHRTTEKR
jgi:hypothetical protein